MAEDWGREQASQLEHIRRESLDVYNRLHSIEHDAAFVRRVHDAYPTLPLLPNLRCGAWYVDPAIATAQPAYFKSTDGHFGNWGFSLRRPNLHLLPLLLAHSGLILVDSTRAGKRLPDALSKTVPIWCAVLNRATHLRRARAPPPGWDAALYTPPGAVSAQEHAQIAARIDGWAAALAASSYALPDLARPLRPLWLTPDAPAFPALDGPAPFVPVLCVSASHSAGAGAGSARRAAGFVYVQGSGDDHELWGLGLAPALFWAHRRALLAAGRARLPGLVAEIVGAERARARTGAWGAVPTPVGRVAGRLLLCATADLPAVLPAPLPAAVAARAEMEGGGVAYVVISADPSLGQDGVGPDGEGGRIAAERDGTHSGAGLETHSRADEAAQENVDGHAGDTDTPAPAPPRVLRLALPAGKRGQHALLHTVLPRATAFTRVHLAAGARVVLACDSGTDASVGAALAALALAFSDSGELLAAPPPLTKDAVRTRLQWIIASRAQANPARTTLKRVHDFLLAPSEFRS